MLMACRRDGEFREESARGCGELHMTNKEDSAVIPCPPKEIFNVNGDGVRYLDAPYHGDDPADRRFRFGNVLDLDMHFLFSSSQ